MRILLLLLALTSAASARETYPGQYSQLSPQLRKWFREQEVPNTNYLCCSEADGEEVEEDIREGRYWARSEATNGQWIQIPDEAVIQGPNMNGKPVSWWRFDEVGQVLKSKCYSPGAKL